MDESKCPAEIAAGKDLSALERLTWEEKLECVVLWLNMLDTLAALNDYFTCDDNEEPKPVVCNNYALPCYMCPHEQKCPHHGYSPEEVDRIIREGRMAEVMATITPRDIWKAALEPFTGKGSVVGDVKPIKDNALRFLQGIAGRLRSNDRRSDDNNSTRSDDQK